MKNLAITSKKMLLDSRLDRCLVFASWGILQSHNWEKTHDSHDVVIGVAAMQERRLVFAWATLIYYEKMYRKQ